MDNSYEIYPDYYFEKNPAIEPKKGNYSPWGKIQTVEKIAEGVWFVSTASHGGVKLSRARNAKIPEYMRQKGGWYEEDCHWCFPALIFPDDFPEKWREEAHSTCKNWYPDQYAKWSGKPVTMKESLALRDRDFKQKTHNKFAVRTAWGDWFGKVPKGMVLILCERESDGAFAYFLVPSTAYSPQMDVEEYEPVELEQYV